jgi:hypothetical protein
MFKTFFDRFKEVGAKAGENKCFLAIDGLQGASREPKFEGSIEIEKFEFESPAGFERSGTIQPDKLSPIVGATFHTADTSVIARLLEADKVGVVFRQAILNTEFRSNGKVRWSNRWTFMEVLVAKTRHPRDGSFSFDLHWKRMQHM